MKQLLAALIFSLSVFTAPILAQEAAPKAYTEMTYQELLAVDTDTLTKAQRKAHKKALSRAKKIERARLRDLEKRRKAAARAKAKRDKAIAKKLRKIDKYRDNTWLKTDEFSLEAKIVGPELNPRFDWNQLFFGSKDLPTFLLIADAKQGSDEQIFHLLVELNERVEGLSIPSLEILDIEPEEYADLKDLWPGFYRALMAGGSKRAVRPVDRLTNGCTEIECFFMERISVDIEAEDVRAALRARAPLSVKLLAESGRTEVIRVRYEYLLGFAARIAEYEARYADFGELADEGRRFVIETTR